MKQPACYLAKLPELIQPSDGGDTSGPLRQDIQMFPPGEHHVVLTGGDGKPVEMLVLVDEPAAPPPPLFGRYTPLPTALTTYAAQSVRNL